MRETAKNMRDDGGDEPLLRVSGLSKKFCRDLKRSLWYGLTDLAHEILPNPDSTQRRGSLRPDEFWAVDDVSFELRRGECLGLIGRNGAGKSTLLKLLNGLIKPDRGRIEIRGRVGALIALGAGFNPILTGRENIYVNAAVLGLTKAEIESRLDEIIEFAELGPFIDSPVQSYSSGMHVRLGFAIASTLDPDILILDEILAVGDASFRHKCYSRIARVMERSAVIIVSHSMDYIAQASSVVAMMDRGRIQVYDQPDRGISAYQSIFQSSAGCLKDGGPVTAVYPPIIDVEIDILTPTVAWGGTLFIQVRVDCDSDLDEAVMSFSAVNSAEQPAMCWHTSRLDRAVRLPEGRQIIEIRISPLWLADGRYYWNFHASRKGSIQHVIWVQRGGIFTVVSDYRPLGDFPYIAGRSELRVRSRDD